MQQNKSLTRLSEMRKERDELFSELSKISLDALTVEIEKDFDKTYITASELCLLIGIDRSVLATGGKKGGKSGPKLPGSVSILHGNLTIWNRNFIMPYAVQWRSELFLKRLPAAQRKLLTKEFKALVVSEPSKNWTLESFLIMKKVIE